MTQQFEDRLRGFRVHTCVARQGVGDREWETLIEKKHQQRALRLWEPDKDPDGEKAKEFHDKVVAFIKKGFFSPDIEKVDGHATAVRREYGHLL